ncbi:hypothetical protein KC325_g250 [Hortaea werneckii]|nr:hypothetical protein KC325_g250 [Hortaea werneckii]
MSHRLGKVPSRVLQERLPHREVLFDDVRYGCGGEVGKWQRGQWAIFSAESFVDAWRHFAVGTLWTLFIPSASLILRSCPWPNWDIRDGYAEKTSEPGSYVRDTISKPVASSLGPLSRLCSDLVAPLASLIRPGCLREGW